MTFDLPDPSEHVAIVLRSGVRYVGHVIRDAELRYVDRSGSLWTIDESSRRVELRIEDIAAVERFTPGYNAAMHCMVCRAQLVDDAATA